MRRALAWILGGPPALVVAIVLVVLFKPRWLINTRTVSWAIKEFGADYRPRWSSFSFELRSPSIAEKAISLAATDFCFDEKSGAVRGCFDRIDLDVAFRLSLKDKVRLTRISRFVVKERSFRIDRRLIAAAPAVKKPAKPKSHRAVQLPSLIPDALRALKIEGLDVELADVLVVESATSSIRAKGAALFEASRPLPLSATADVRLPGARRLRANLDVGSDFFTRGELTTLTARGRLNGPGALTASLEARARQRGAGEIGLDAAVRASSGPIAARLVVKDFHRADEDDVDADLSVSAASGSLRAARLSGCRARVLRSAGALSAASLDCGARAELGKFALTSSSWPRTLDGYVRATAQVQPGAARAFSGKLTVGLGPPRAWYRLFASISTRFKGRLTDLPGSLSLDHSLFASLDGPFEDLVRYLKGTPYPVPAPFNALKGPIEVTVQSSGSPLAKEQAVSYRATLDLAGPPQRLRALVEGTLRANDPFGPGLSLDDETKVTLQEVALTLPYLKIGAPPTVTADKRIYMGTPRPAVDPPAAPASTTAAAGFPFQWKVTVVTAKPVELLSNLTESPIPISLNLLADAAGLAGKITIQRFSAKLFKQTAVIDHIALTAAPAAQGMNLDGLILYKTADAMIHILLLGSTAKPQVTLQSDPPLTQQEIIALLLYGKSPDALDYDQASSVGNAQSALASGAFGLASLYLFASTPIDYVGYDPTSQTYSMKFRLPGGASLTVGSNTLEESRSVSVRKRLAPHWAIETQARKSPSEGNVVETILEWFERY